MLLNIIVTSRSICTFDLMCHINSSQFMPISLRNTCALLSSYRSCKQGWMYVLNHSIKLMEEFKLLQAQETRALLLCSLTHNKTFQVDHSIYQRKVKRYVIVQSRAHIRTCKSMKVSIKAGLWGKVEKIFLNGNF